MSANPEPLVIDDVDPSIAALSDIGRAVCEPSARAIQTAVKAFCARRGWPVLSHQRFSEWASHLIRSTNHRWIVLDPVFPMSGVEGQAASLRLSREFEGNQDIYVRRFIRGRSPTALDIGEVGSAVGIVDDIAASGNTLCEVVGLLADAGVSVDKVALAVSSREACARLRRRIPQGRHHIQLQGEWRGMHLRDGCAFLPYAGRTTAIIPANAPDSDCPIEVRLSTTEVDGSLWQVLYLDHDVRRAVDAARANVPLRLQEVLGRVPSIRDLPLLGVGVPATLTAVRGVAPDDRLCDLVKRGPVT